MEDHAVPNEQHPARVGGGVRGVGDHQDGLPVPVHLGEDLQQLRGRPGIQRAGGLVRQNQLRVRDQRPRGGSPLLLPAGDLVGVFVQNLRDAERPRRLHQPRLHFGDAFPAQHQRQQDVVLQREGVQQVELLKHEAQVLPAEGGQLVFLHRVQPLALQLHVTAGGLIQRR